MKNEGLKMCRKWDLKIESKSRNEHQQLFLRHDKKIEQGGSGAGAVQRRKAEKQPGCGCQEAPNCLLQHVMTSLVYINLSLLRPISVLMQRENRLISAMQTQLHPLTTQRVKGIDDGEN